MRLRNAGVMLLIAFAIAPGTAMAEFRLMLDPNGEVLLVNESVQPMAFSGYTISSEANLLDPSNWHGITHRAQEDPESAKDFFGNEVVHFQIAAALDHNLSEVLPQVLPQGNHIVWRPQYALSLGMTYRGDPSSWPGDLNLSVSARPIVPEPPSGYLLAVAVIWGLLACIRRRR